MFLKKNGKMRIAVCDDEKRYREKIVNLIQEYEKIRQNYSFTVSAFSSAKALLNFKAEHGGFDLYILDILMPEMSGIRLGSALREQGDEGMILYLTTSPDFAVDSYTVEAFQYLLKPIDAVPLFRCLDKAADRFDELQKKAVAIKLPGSVRIISVHNICYAERVRRLICYHLIDHSVISSATFNGTFQNAVAPLLEHKEFLLVGSSFVVNLRHVTEITRHELILNGNHKISIPRGKYETYKTKWSDYWLNGGE